MPPPLHPPTPQYRALCTLVLVHIGALPCGPPSSPGKDLYLPGVGARVSTPPLKHIVSLSFQHTEEIPVDKKCPLWPFFFPALCYEQLGFSLVQVETERLIFFSPPLAERES